MTDQPYLRALLRTIGTKKHGETWKARMAEDLRCSRAAITLWDQGERKINRFVGLELERMARKLGIKQSDVNVLLFIDSVNQTR